MDGWMDEEEEKNNQKKGTTKNRKGINRRGKREDNRSKSGLAI